MKIKRIILALALLFTNLLVNAQDKYEFMIITYFPQGKLMTVALDGKEVLNENIDADKYERISGNPVLKKINEYQGKDWELITFTNATDGPNGNQVYYAYLKKKKLQTK